MTSTEIVTFHVRKANGGWVAVAETAGKGAIVTQASGRGNLRREMADAVRCHFGDDGEIEVLAVFPNGTVDRFRVP